MQGYRCGKCRKQLIADAVFCVHCDSFFTNAVPTADPAGDQPVYLNPDGFRRSRRAPFAAAMLAFAACAAGFLFATFTPGTAATPIKLVNGHDAIPESEVMDALNADIESDQLCTYEAKRNATDIVLRLTTGCDLVHSPRADTPYDSVLMFAKEPLTPHQAANRAKFAMLMLRGIRGEWYTDPHQQYVRVALIGSDGVWLAKATGEKRNDFTPTFL